MFHSSEPLCDKFIITKYYTILYYIQTDQYFTRIYILYIYTRLYFSQKSIDINVKNFIGNTVNFEDNNEIAENRTTIENRKEYRKEI